MTNCLWPFHKTHFIIRLLFVYLFQEPPYDTIRQRAPQGRKSRTAARKQLQELCFFICRPRTEQHHLPQCIILIAMILLHIMYIQVYYI